MNETKVLGEVELEGVTNIPGEITIIVVASCGHATTVETPPDEVVSCRAHNASRPCSACVWAAETVELWQAGDLNGTQRKLVDWVQAILASDDHRTRRLMALVKQVD